MTDLVVSTDHDIPEEDADYAAGVRQVSMVFAAIIALAVASTAIFGFAGLITFFVAAAALMLVTLVVLTLG